MNIGKENLEKLRKELQNRRTYLNSNESLEKSMSNKDLAKEVFEYAEKLPLREKLYKGEDFYVESPHFVFSGHYIYNMQACGMELYIEKNQCPWVFSFDVETDGLWGSVFAIGAVVLNSRGEKQCEFGGKLKNFAPKNEWVQKNVMPRLNGFDFEDYNQLLLNFSKFYLKWHKEGVIFVVHMGYICESLLLREMKEKGYIGEWDAPYPLYDVSGYLDAIGEDPTSVDKYAKKLGISCEGETHNPVYDAWMTGKIFIRTRKKILSVKSYP